jgi:hypothetical protein
MSQAQKAPQAQEIKNLRPWTTRQRPPLVSVLYDEPSPLDTIQILGEESKRYVTLPSLYSYAASSLPQVLAIELSRTYTSSDLRPESRFDSITHAIMDFLRGSKFVRSVGPQESFVTIAELHRPKIDGCKSSFTQTYTTSLDFSFSVKVFGIGGGVSKGRTYSFADSTEITKECIELVLPITIIWQEYKSRDGVTFYRADVENIGDDYVERVLKGPLDLCGLAEDKIKKSRWLTHNFPEPDGVTRKRELYMEAGQSAEVSIQPKIAGVEIGPKVSVKYLKRVDFTYVLVGPHNYLAYVPKNSLSYYWNWS